MYQIKKLNNMWVLTAEHPTEGNSSYKEREIAACTSQKSVQAAFRLLSGWEISTLSEETRATLAELSALGQEMEKY